MNIDRRHLVLPALAVGLLGVVPALATSADEDAVKKSVEAFRLAQIAADAKAFDALCAAERLHALLDRVFFRRSRQGRDGTQKSDGKSRQNQVTTIDVHCFLRFSCFELSLCRQAISCPKRSRAIHSARTKT